MNDNEKDTKQREQIPNSEPSGGIFITKEMQIKIPPFAIKFSNEGIIESSNLELHVGLDMCPRWLRIAYEHLKASELNNTSRVLASMTSEDEKLELALESEFSASMQAITSAAFAIDAFYAIVKEQIDITPETIQAWRENRTARNAQIFEVISRGFTVGTESKKHIRQILKEIKRFRDLAVHPSGQSTSPLFHPELHKHTEWRFVYYRFQNAKLAVSAVLSLVAQLAKIPKKKYPRLKMYCEGLDHSMSQLVEEWEQQYGLLYVRNEGNDSGIKGI